MKIIIKLVGYSEIINENKYVYQMILNAIKFNFAILKTEFMKYNDILDNEDLNKCTLTCNSKNLKKETLYDNNNKIYKIFIFTNNGDVKNKLITIFKSYGNKNLINTANNIVIEDKVKIIEIIKIEEIKEEIKEEINEEIKEEINETIEEIITEEKEEIKEEIIKTIEEEIEEYDFDNIKINLELFNNPDFICLLKIYKKEPSLLNELYKYISSSDIIIPSKIINNNYEKNFIIIKDLGLNFSDLDIINALKITNNHINFAIRFLLNNPK